jgi:transcriptional regulator with XRE-family HTH domain
LTRNVIFSIIWNENGYEVSKGGSKVKRLSTTKLAETLKTKREEKGFTQNELSSLTGINRVMISRIEHKSFIPSITQFEALARVLDFEITDMFVEKQQTNSFIALRSETLSGNEKKGVDKLFSMILSLRQQVLLRSKFENEQLRRS